MTQNSNKWNKQQNKQIARPRGQSFISGEVSFTDENFKRVSYFSATMYKSALHYRNANVDVNEPTKLHPRPSIDTNWCPFLQIKYRVYLFFVTVVCRHPPAPIFGHCGEGGRPVRPRKDAPVRTGDENRHLHADQWTMLGRKKKYHILLTINSKLSSKIQDLIHPRRASHNISLVTATTLAIITATFCNGWLHVAPKKRLKRLYCLTLG